MKSQDIVLLFKVISVNNRHLCNNPGADSNLHNASAPMINEELGNWGLWADSSKAVTPLPGDRLGNIPAEDWGACFSLRVLANSLGLSKSEVANSIGRCREAGLLVNDLETERLTVDRRALFGIAEHALRYFFPVKPGAIVRGIPTAFASPILNKHLRSAGELILVWPDASGTEKGQAVTPLYKSVPDAVKKDRGLYELLSLVDAMRIGGPRERKVAAGLLQAEMGL